MNKKDYSRLWRLENKRKIAAYMKIYNCHNKYTLAEKRKIRQRHRLLSDPSFKLRRNLQRRLQLALNGIGKSITTIQFIGCSLEELWLHLARKFQLGMTRYNYGTVWQLDHIKPCSKFDLTKFEQQQQCFHYSNLQPLFEKQNLLKGAS